MTVCKRCGQGMELKDTYVAKSRFTKDKMLRHHIYLCPGCGFRCKLCEEEIG